MNDTVSSADLPRVAREELQAQLRAVIAVSEPTEPPPSPEPAGPSRRRPGRPRQVAADQLWLGLLWAVLEGLSGYRALARLLATRALGRFAPVSVTSQALLRRLQQAGLAPLQEVFASLGAWMAVAVPTPACDLAPFATRILALDETNLDVLDILAEVPWRSLLLFDLGYFSFPLFDYLSEREVYWISRYREKTRYQLLHVYYQHGVMLDALVWLGSAHGPRAGRAVRLVRFGDGQQLRLYLTNVRDPLLLPMGDIACLYARRWDIELAFLTLKELLGLHCWWSSQLPLILQQISLTLLLAQVLQALRLHLAEQADCDPFDVSLPLLVQHLPQLLRARQHPVDWVLTYGRTQRFLRPSRRLQVVAPFIPAEQIQPLPPDLVLLRKACYRTYKPRPPRPAGNKDKKKQATAQAPAGSSSPPSKVDK